MNITELQQANEAALMRYVTATIERDEAMQRVREASAASRKAHSAYMKAHIRALDEQYEQRHSAGIHRPDCFPGRDPVELRASVTAMAIERMKAIRKEEDKT